MADLLHHHHHHDPTNQAMVSAPHGPETGDDHAHYPATHTTENEKAIFNYLLHPDDTYTPEGVYWADLPIGQRISFVTKVNNAETASELKAIGALAWKDPLAPVAWYFKNAVLPGAGLGLEGYVLFSIGNLTPLFQAVWPTCWKTYKVCNEQWTYTVTYLEVIGIICGQISVGLLGDGIGRRWGLCQDAFIMFLGLCMLTASWGDSLNGWIICYAWSLYVYGVGVGGEYPMTATAAMENATGSGRVSTRADRLHRGRNVTMAFLMQGWGQFLLQGCRPMDLQNLIRHSCCRNALACLFGGRVLATAGGWFCNDIFFYGNKLFQSKFIKVISPSSSSVMTGWLWNLLNVGCSLCGYYLASFLIDNKLYGRKWMQQVGFLLCFVLFVVPAFHYNYYVSIHHIHAFQAMYFLSSFFNQFGPNSVTFLVAAEVYPTPVRASAHGFSAAIGKLGALVAAILYNYITTQQIFYVVPWFGLAGMILTAIWLPDTTGLDLKEQERRWQYIREGRGHEYHGVAVHPHHLSLWERMRGLGKQYNPELDYQSKINDMRADWELKQQEKAENENGLADEEDDYSDEVHNYFTHSSKNTPIMAPMAEKKVSGADSDETGNEKVVPQ